MVPLGAFKEQTSDEGTVLGLLSDVGHWARSGDEVEVQLVDGRTLVILTSELLQQTSGETSGVSVGRDPVDERRHLHLVGPFLEELVPFVEVHEPVGQTLLREVGERPFHWHNVLRQASHHDFQVGRDHNETLDTLLELIESGGQDAQKDVVTLNLLNEDDIERTVLLGLVELVDSLLDGRNAHGLGSALTQFDDQVQDGVVATALATRGNCGLERKDR